MNRIQVVILAVVVGVAACSRCFPESELEEEARRMLKRLRQPHMHHLDAAVADGSSGRCPVEQYGQQESERSLSPWTYVRVVRPELFPSSYVDARCLCTGCIINRTEAHHVNSLPLRQSRHFVRRQLCGGDHNGTTTYSLEVEAVSVAVGCTCVRPRV